MFGKGVYIFVYRPTHRHWPSPVVDDAGYMYIKNTVFCAKQARIDGGYQWAVERRCPKSESESG
jgi:hypothetical protein